MTRSSTRPRQWPCMRVLALSILTSFASSAAWAEGCDAFLAESEAIEGVVPKLNENGQVRALVMYGEATFIAPKRSLITNARRKAELSAKRAFSEWLKQDLSSESVQADMMEAVQVTNQDGDTAGVATEISQTLDVIRTDTNAVLSGIVKLDECVDTTEKYVLVELGWKPSLSRAAGTAKATMNREIARDEPSRESPIAQPAQTADQQTTAAGANKTQGAALGKKTVEKRGGISIVIVEVEGVGSDLKGATNEALRSAVAQVYGEAFASRQQSVDMVATIEATNSQGDTAGLAVEQTASVNEVSSSTSGLIDSYEYMSKQDQASGYRVVLRVKIPKYESTIDPNKNTIVVLPLKVAPGVSSAEAADVVDLVRDNIESLLGDTKSLAVLDRQNLGAQQNELAYLASGAAPISEMARIGNAAGADFMLITELVSFDRAEEQSQLAGRSISRSVFNADVSVKVIEVASTNIMFSRVIPFQRLKYRTDNSRFEFSNEVATTVSRQVANRVGGGFTQARARDIDQGSNRKAKERAAAEKVVKKASDRMNKMKKEAENDW